MTIRQQIEKASANLEMNARATEFAALAKYILANDGKLSKAAISAAASSREGNLGPKLAMIIKAGGAGEISREMMRQQKATVVAGGLTGSPLADYSQIANGFINSLVNVSCFDTMLASMRPTPLTTGTVGAVSVSVQAFSVSEASAKSISRLSIVGQQQNPQKVTCGIVVSQELARMAGANATALIGRELRNATAVTTDSAFVTNLIAGLSAFTSTGSTAESLRADLANLLRSISTGAASKLFILTTSLICKSWSMLTSGAHGDSAFPDLGPQGGSINKIPVLVSDGVPTGNVILADANGIAAANGDLTLAEYKEGSIELETSPTSPPSASSGYISLWQMGLSAILIERFLIAVRLRSDAVAVCSNSNSYQSGNSPP